MCGNGFSRATAIFSLLPDQIHVRSSYGHRSRFNQTVLAHRGAGLVQGHRGKKPEQPDSLVVALSPAIAPRVLDGQRTREALPRMSIRVE